MANHFSVTVATKATENDFATQRQISNRYLMPSDLVSGHTTDGRLSWGGGGGIWLKTRLSDSDSQHKQNYRCVC